MSPRSEEFAAEARERLAAARDSIEGGHFGVAVGAAYYAMLYVARAALSERNLYAKTHGGTWSLFDQHFVKGGHVDQRVAAQTRKAERVRYEADYEAAAVDRELAEAILADAERFVSAVLAVIE